MKRLFQTFVICLISGLSVFAQELQDGTPQYVLEIIDGVPQLVGGSGSGSGPSTDTIGDVLARGINAAGYGITNLSTLLPASSNTADWGSAALPVRTLHLGTSLNLVGTELDGVDTNAVLMADGSQAILGSLLPSVSNAYDIGSQSLPFREIHSSNFNAVGSSYSINGTPVLGVSTAGQPVIYGDLEATIVIDPAEELTAENPASYSKVMDSLDYFAGEILYSGSNLSSVVLGALKLETAPITYFEGGFPITAGTNYMLYASETVRSFTPKGLYRGQFYCEPLSTNLTQVAWDVHTQFLLGVIPESTPYSTNLAVVGTSNLRTVKGSGGIQRIDLEGSLAADLDSSTVGEDFYVGGMLVIVSPSDGFLNFRSGGTDYPAKMTIPIPTGDLPTKQWVQGYVAQQVYYAGESVIVSNAALKDFDVALNSSAGYMSLATTYLSCTNPVTTNSTCTLSVYIHPSRSGAYAQYRGDMTYGWRTVATEAVAGTNIVEVNDSSLFAVNDLVAFDAWSQTALEFRRVLEVVDGTTIKLENVLVNTQAVGNVISKCQQFGNFMYYDLAGSNTFYGQLRYTNTVDISHLKISLTYIH